MAVNKPTDKGVTKLLKECGYHSSIPNIDSLEFLGFLFKHAVPDDVTIQFQQHSKNLDCVIFDGGEWYSGKAGRKEYALALFWALYKSIKEG